MLTGADPEIREGGHGIGKQHILLTVLGIVDHLKELGRVSTKVSTSSEPPSPPKGSATVMLLNPPRLSE